MFLWKPMCLQVSVESIVAEQSTSGEKERKQNNLSSK